MTGNANNCCGICNLPLKVGDRVRAMETVRRGKPAKVAHALCWERENRGTVAPPRTCPECKLEKAETDFGFRVTSAGTKIVQSWCKVCRHKGHKPRPV